MTNKELREKVKEIVLHDSDVDKIMALFEQVKGSGWGDVRIDQTKKDINTYQTWCPNCKNINTLKGQAYSGGCISIGDDTFGLLEGQCSNCHGSSTISINDRERWLGAVKEEILNVPIDQEKVNKRSNLEETKPTEVNGAHFHAPVEVVAKTPNLEEIKKKFYEMMEKQFHKDFRYVVGDYGEFETNTSDITNFFVRVTESKGFVKLVAPLLATKEHDEGLLNDFLTYLLLRIDEFELVGFDHQKFADGLVKVRDGFTSRKEVSNSNDLEKGKKI